MNITQRLSAYAKLNLALIVGEKIPPLGYHKLESIFLRLGMHDQVVINTNISENTKSKIFINCRFDHRLASHIKKSKHSLAELKALIEGEEGILFKTCTLVLQALPDQFKGLDVHIELIKSVPLEAGLGGGSADVASVLNFFSKHYRLSEKAKIQIANKVGFDVAPCLYMGPSYSCYDGQHQTLPLNFPTNSSRRYALILKPPVGSNTRLAYLSLMRGEIKADSYSGRLFNKEKIEALLEKTLGTNDDNGMTANLIQNDFQNTVFKEIPELEQILLALAKYDPMVSGLSGSGSSIFALFKDYKTVLKAYHDHMSLSENGWFIAISQILSL